MSEYYKKNRKRWLLYGARVRARKIGAAFDLTPNDVVIPKVCPVFKTPLYFGRGKSGPNSPTLDRILPELGYVKGNVWVISELANRIKTDAKWPQILAVAKALKKKIDGIRTSVI